MTPSPALEELPGLGSSIPVTDVEIRTAWGPRARQQAQDPRGSGPTRSAPREAQGLAWQGRGGGEHHRPGETGEGFTKKARD